MKHSLLIYGWLLVAGLLGSQSLRAQGVVAGQKFGITYVDIPDIPLGAATSGPYTQLDSLDLDADGRFDLRFTAYASSSSFESAARVLPLHDNVAIYSGSQSPVIVGFALNDSIKQRIAQPTPTLPPNVWSSRSTIYPSAPSYLTYEAYSPPSSQSYGNWLDAKDHYMGVRLRSTAAAGWRYGWVRIQVYSYANAVIFTVKDYALSPILLAQQPARAAGWHLYPVPTNNLLTVQSATAATGQLILSDAQGRVHLRQAFTGTSQQLDLSALAAGLYLIRLQTSAGSFTQRITKQ